MPNTIKTTDRAYTIKELPCQPRSDGFTHTVYFHGDKRVAEMDVTGKQRAEEIGKRWLETGEVE